MPATPCTPTRLLASLNLFGLGHLDPVILAALADERPLLLIAPHGTAKSELLNRLAAALGLDHRHYNASLIAFDDLLGFAVPNAARTGLDYLATPGNLWNAESVFLDEISRCRPEHQNKLFSVIHEKRIQGLALPRLRYRWSAMNPPVTGDEEEHEEVFLRIDPKRRAGVAPVSDSLPRKGRSPVGRVRALHIPTEGPDTARNVVRG